MRRLLALLVLVLLAPLASAGSETHAFDTGLYAPRSAYGYQQGEWADHLFTIAKAPPGTTAMTLNYTSWTRRTLRATNAANYARTIVVHGATNNTTTIDTIGHDTCFAPSVGTDSITLVLPPGVSEYTLEYQGSNAVPVPIHSSYIPAFEARRSKYANAYLYGYVVYSVDGVVTHTGGLVDPNNWESLGIYCTDIWNEPETAADPVTHFWGTVTYETP